MKKIISAILIFFLLFSCCLAEEDEEDIWISKELHVIANLLNGRAKPSKKSTVEARFDKYDTVEATGEWSNNHEWVEVMGGESGTVWCSIQYVSEIYEPVIYENRGRQRIKIRKKPIDGRVVAYLYGGKTIKITQIVNGWGKSKKGWIDMSYLVEGDPEE